MPTVVSNGIEVAYEEHCDAGKQALLLVQGLGMPLSSWPPAMIDGLVAEGFRVITVDNRDIGRSQLLREMTMSNMLWQTVRRRLGIKVRAPYQLGDMTRDVAGLLDALNIDTEPVRLD